MKQFVKKSKKPTVLLLLTVLFSLPLLFAGPVLDSLSGGLSLFMAVLGIGAKDFVLEGTTKFIAYGIVYLIWVILAFSVARAVTSPFFKRKPVLADEANEQPATETS